jgi:hypothetical protein
MITPVVEKGETLAKPPFDRFSIRPIRRPGHFAEGQVKVACAHPVVPAGPGESPSVYDSSGKIIADRLPGRQRRICSSGL